MHLLWGVIKWAISHVIWEIIGGLIILLYFLGIIHEWGAPPPPSRLLEMSQKEKLRMIGVDTPETVHPKKEVQHYGKEASDYMKKALTDKKVWLQMDAGPRDRYQRLLAYVWTEKPNDADNEQEIRTKMFNARLLLEGYGQVMTIQPNSKYADMFTKFQGEARDGNRGLWEVQ